MTLNHIWSLSARMLGEEPDARDVEDLRRRAAALICALCAEWQEADRLYRETWGKEAGSWNGASLTPEDEFPLCPRFSSAAAKRLAAMLIIGENRDLYELFADEARQDMERIMRELPAEVGRITQKYGK